MSRLPASLVVPALALLAACHRAGGSEPFGTVAVDEVDRLVQAGSARVYDANGPDTYAEGHVPGATLVAHGKVDPKLLPAGKTVKLVFYCMNPR
ncbi:MAG TPA: rhodanese-like domain-containing protein [Anaeromyxobacteraceae bacterium]|nr:rhodanese-like domain-containing protein [Anaeromyxobacteraceae bacterium]